MPSTRCGFVDGPGGLGSELLVYHGPTLHVRVGFDPAYAGAPGTIPSLPGDDLEALVDTGATESCIDRGLAMQLNLPVVDQVTIGGIGGKYQANVHLAQIYIPALNFVVYGAFSGVDLVAGGQRHVALIGRTFLRNVTMTYNGLTGSVELSR